MTLSLASIHQPFNTFFLDRFQLDGQGPVVFRFDKFGSVVSDDDFKDPRDPDGGYSPALATEKFSDLVNRIPLDVRDGLNVVLSADSIDDSYHARLLAPSVPAVPQGASEQDAQTITESFNSVKAAGLSVWEQVKLESSTGVMLQFKPSVATPEAWYDRSKNDVWTHHSFEIGETSPGPDAGGGAPDAKLWKLKVSDEVLATAIKRVELAPNLLIAAPASAPSTTGLGLARRIVDKPAAVALREPRAAPVLLRGERTPKILGPEQNQPVNIGATHIDRHELFRRSLPSLAVSSKLAILGALAERAPQEPVKANHISISFDYCLVTIDRHWYSSAFINHPSWYVPGVPRGQVTDAGVPASMALLPIGLVAIRALEIAGNWTDDDLEHAGEATDFGPFKIEGTFVEGRISHPGLQVVGWLLQRLPALPPCELQA